MTTTKFRGTCIGGPMDGQILVAVSREFVVPVATPVRAASGGRSPVATVVSLARVKYVWRHWECGGVVLEFWAPEADEIGDVLARLIAGYRPRAA